MVSIVSLIAGYAFLGGSLKYIDCAYKKNSLQKLITIALSVACGYIMWFLASNNPASSIIFVSVIVGVFVSGKIDNVAFYAGTITFGAYFLSFTPETNVVMTAIVTVAVIADEKLDRIPIKTKFGNYRPLTEIIILALAVLGFMPYINLIAFLCFDAAYLLVDRFATDK